MERSIQPVRLGPLTDVRPGPEADGGRVACENLRPVVVAGQPCLESVAGPVRVLPAVSGILSAYREVRERALDDSSTSVARALDRWLILTDSAIVAYLPDGSASTTLYSFDVADNGRRMACQPAGRYTLALVRGADENPVATLLITDDGAVPYGPLPSASGRTSSGNAGSLTRGRCLIGFAPLFRGGQVGPITAMHAAARDEDWFVAVLAYREVPDPIAYAADLPGQPTTQDVWNEEVVGTAAYVAYLPADSTSGPLPSWEQVIAQPFVRVATFQRAQGEAMNEPEVRVEDPPSSTSDEARFDNLLAARAAAGTSGLRYNGRQVLGGVAWTFAPPPVHQFRDFGDNTGNSTNILLRVEIEELGETVIVEQAFAVELNAAGDTLFLDGGLLFYPDRRATRFSLHRITSAASKTYQITPFASFDAIRDDSTNIAIARANSADAIDGAQAYESQWAGIPFSIFSSAVATYGEPWQPSTDANRIAATEAGDVWTLSASTVQQIGDGPDDAVLTILAGTEAPSEGQYGAAPLIVFNRRSTWAIDAPFVAARQSITPLAIGQGIAGFDAAVGVGRGLVGADADGLRAFTPAPERTALSADVRDRLAVVLPVASLGWLTAGRSEEVWLTDNTSRVWCYCLSTGQWYYRPLSRRSFARCCGTLYGIDNQGRLWEEDADKTSAQAVRIETHRLDLGARGQAKRISRGRVEAEPAPDTVQIALIETTDQGSTPTDETRDSIPFVQVGDGGLFRHPYGSVTAPRLLLTASAPAGRRLLGIALETQVRYAHRLRPLIRAFRA